MKLVSYSIPVENIKKNYPKGTYIEILRLNDPHIQLPIGTLGKVLLVDEFGRIYVLLKSKRIITLDINDDIIRIVKPHKKGEEQSA